MRLGPQATAAGLEVRTPPCELHPLQVVPFQVFWASALLESRLKTSTLAVPHEEAAALEVRLPPIDTQPAGGGPAEAKFPTVNVHV